MVRKRLYFVLLFGLYLSAFADNSLGNGLRFRSFEVDKDKRTSLNLTPDKPLKFPQGFSMEFEFSLSAKGENFGYIFRIIGNDSLNIDFLSDVRTSSNFSLIIGNKKVAQFDTKEIQDFDFGQWIKIKINCNLKENKVAFLLNDRGKTVDYPFTGLSDFRIYFGGNSDAKFSTSDIPPMSIKDIRIYNEKATPVRNWELLKHGDNCVYDCCGNDRAIVVNPVWEIDSHVTWQKKMTFSLPEISPKIAYDKQANRVFIVGKRQLIAYDIPAQTSDSVQYISGTPFNENCNQLVYDEKKSRLISYNFFNNELNYFDFTSKKWTNDSDVFVEPRFWHNNKYYFSDDSMLVAVGGYGYHKYSALLQKYNGKENVWEKTDISPDISPRYLSSMGPMKDSLLLLFGGYGSATGEQYESPHNYYDLYVLNAYTNQVSKLWNIEAVKDNYTTANSLVYNEISNSFYTLAYANNKYESALLLHEYSISRPEFKVYGDSIPYFFNDVESYCDLYFPANRSELIAVASWIKNNKTEINVYSIAFPPLNREDIRQIEKSKSLNPKLLFLLVALLTLILLTGSLLVLKNRLRKRHSEWMGDEEWIAPVISKAPKLPEEKEITPSISLLGDFKILDSDGNNLSNNLTSTTKHVFLMILITTARKKEQLTSEMFHAFFWPDRDSDSARNNRNVYINRLRSMLKNVGDLKIFKQDGCWIISDLKEIYCDYERILSLLKQFNENQDFDFTLLSNILDIAQKGKLLPYYEAEWLDEYKSHYSNLLIEFLLEIVNLPELQNDLPLLLRISNIILLQDNTDETGIRMKCKTLVRLGKKNQALRCFKKFSEEHKILFGVETTLKFEDMLKKDF